MKRGKCPNCETYGIGTDELNAVKNAEHQSGCQYASTPKEVKEKPKKSKKSTSSSDEE